MSEYDLLLKQSPPTRYDHLPPAMKEPPEVDLLGAADAYPGSGYARKGERANLEIPDSHIKMNENSAISNGTLSKPGGDQENRETKLRWLMPVRHPSTLYAAGY